MPRGPSGSASRTISAPSTLASPLCSIAAPTPNDAAIATSTRRSTDSRASSVVRQRVSTSAPAASNPAWSNEIQPAALATIIATTIPPASHARSWRGAALPSTPATSANAASFLRARRKFGCVSSSSVSPALSSIVPILPRTRSPRRCTAMIAAL